MITRMLAEAWRLTTAVAADPAAALLLLIYGLTMTVVIAVTWHYLCAALAHPGRRRLAHRTAENRVAQAVPVNDEQWERLAALEELWKLPTARLTRTARTRRRLRGAIRRARTHI